MSKLSETYKKVKPAVVAIVQRMSKDPTFPPIIGTGFIARENGIILTNNHVIDEINKLPKIEGEEEECSALVLLFYDTGKEFLLIPMPIYRLIDLRGMQHHEHYYGPEVPDIGAILVGFKGLPAVNIVSSGKLYEGEDIAISGFPMGTETLKAPGWLHQLSPTLQKGIISAILPTAEAEPHAIMLDIITEGGTSGSPVFRVDSGDVIGMVYAGLKDSFYICSDNNQAVSFEGVLPTAHTFAVPYTFLNIVLNDLNNLPDVKSFYEKVQLEDFTEYIKNPPKNELTPKKPLMTMKGKLKNE